MMNVFLVGLGGFLGASGRYLAYILIKNIFPSSFPIATLLVNILGCFAMGVLTAHFERVENLPHATQLLLFMGPGLLGGFTTFSAFSIETVTLMRTSHINDALMSVVAHLVLCIAAAALGRYVYPLQ